MQAARRRKMLVYPSCVKPGESAVPQDYWKELDDLVKSTVEAFENSPRVISCDRLFNKFSRFMNTKEKEAFSIYESRVFPDPWGYFQMILRILYA